VSIGLRTTADIGTRYLQEVNRYRRDSDRRPRNRKHLCTNDLKALDLRDSLSARHKSLVYGRTATSSILVRTASLIITPSRSVRQSVGYARFDRLRCLEIRSEQEKDRLAHLMAYGTDPNKMPNKAAERSPTPPRQLDRFDECRRDIALSQLMHVEM
jgi:hypothetical protein